MSLLAQWKPHILQLHHQIKITHNIQYHLNWWNNPQIYLKGVPIKTPFFSPGYSQMPVRLVGELIWNQRLIIPWSLDPRPITTPYQSSRNDGHNSCLETNTPSHNQFSSLSLYRQHNCCSSSSTTRQNSLSRSLSRSVEHTHLVLSK